MILRSDSSSIQKQAHSISAKPSTPEIHIASLIVYVKPDSRQDTIQSLQALPECTVYEDPEKVPLVVVVEVDNEHGINQIISDLNARPGTLSINLVYHHCDSVDALSQETAQ